MIDKKTYLQKNQKGFSILELILVMLVAAIIFARVSLDIQQSSQDAKSANVAHALVADLRYAQELAITSSRSITFSITPTNYNARWSDDNTLIGRAGVTGAAPVNETITDGTTIVNHLGGSLQFDIWGSPSVGGVAISSGSDRQVASVGGIKTIMIVPSTGYLYMQ